MVKRKSRFSSNWSNGKLIKYMQSSNSYAVGDSCAVNYNPTGEKVRISLATNAVRLELCWL